MANETRMNKYKDFRDSFKDDEQPIKQVVDDSVGEDDFLSFLPHNNEKDDLHPLSYDTLEAGLKHFIDIKIQFIALYRLFFLSNFLLFNVVNGGNYYKYVL